MTKLTGILRNDAKEFGGVSEYDFTTRTGFENLDYLNGQISVLDDGTKQLYTGVSNGRMIMIIAKSGAGKSTMAMQISHNIATRYGDKGLVYLYDFEQDNNIERYRSVTGATNAWCAEHLTIYRDNISTDKLFKALVQVKKFKLEHEKDFLVDNENGIKDETGKVVQVMAPTVFIVDSLAMMMPSDNLENDEMQGSMNATAIAKANTQFFKRVVQVCNKANIIMIFVNHITQQIAMGVTPPSAVVNYLKQDEAISGGKAAIYITDTLIKITTGAKLEEDKLWGIKGFEAKVEICKSRHAPAGRSVNMIFDQTNGFQNELSMLDYLKSNGKLKGNGMAYYIEGYENCKFRLSNFKEKLNSNPEFKAAFIKLARNTLYTSIKESENTYVENVEDIPEELTNNEPGSESA